MTTFKTSQPHNIFIRTGILTL